ncbi:ELMO domain-containing protein 2 isoform X4 [Falco naumanni]|uniref:ELMO domain-containing protein 2 isoform X4 n=1 Tax=Falco naumanni TaxID=148594 RepID=UPI001ADE1982|nr:ELMO domain-containing protein 2 isoform X4 [Falco naumanni]
MLVHLWGFLYSSYVRFWLKWLWRLVTGKCELQRLLDGCGAGARRTLSIEHSLESSKSKVLRNAVHVEEAEVEKCVRDVMKEKKIEQKDTRFKTNLHISLLQISGYKKLYLNVENLRKVPYDSENEEHEEQLIELWNLLMPHENLKARITKQWCDIGFQGDDPKTDFRGMGLLGLVNLVYFSKHYTDEARQILSRSNHPKLGMKKRAKAERREKLNTEVNFRLGIMCSFFFFFFFFLQNRLVGTENIAKYWLWLAQ